MRKSITTLILVLLCGTGYSQSCPYSLNFYYPEYATWQVYNAASSITTQYNYYIGPGQDITFKAGDYIVLTPESAIISGSEFLAAIEACGSSGRVAGLQDVAAHKLTAYPNPTTGSITVSGLPVSEISLFDVSGKQISRTLYYGSDMLTVDMVSLQAGVYLLRVTGTDGSAETHKIVKN